MTEQTEQVVAKPEMETASTPEVNVNEVMSRLEKLESSNTRLLDESKAWKSKYQGLKGEIEEKETQIMTENNDFKSLYEKTQEELAQERAMGLERDRNDLKSSLKFEVAKSARDAEDVDLLISAISSKKDGLAYDKEAGVWEGVDSVIGELRKEKPFLFSKERVGLSNGRPLSEPPKEKSQRERLIEDPNSVLNDVLASFIK